MDTPTSPNNQSADNNTILDEIVRLTQKIQGSHLPAGLAEKCLDQIHRVEYALRFGSGYAHIEAVSRYIEWSCSLPWNTLTSDSLDIKKAQDIMDKNHFGLADVKKRILEYLSVLLLQKQKLNVTTYHAPILFLVGLAGTGKTTFAKSIAETMGRSFARIPFGGLSSSTDLRGIPKNQLEAEPGYVLKALRRVGNRNPVVLLDEIDRVTPEARGAIMGVLIELLDPEQNNTYTDHYIDYPFDLSSVIFIATANNTNNIATAVLDRLEVIAMPSYSDEEKITIAKSYLFPKFLKQSGLTEENVKVDESVWQKIARMSGYDPGIRSVERKVETIVRRCAFNMVSGQGNQFFVNEANFKEYVE